MSYHISYSPYTYTLYPAPYVTPYWTAYTAREYPPVDTQQFTQSVTSFRKLMRDGSLILSKLSEANFAYQLMAAAQAGNQHEVDRLIATIGTESKITSKYTPSAIHFTIDPNVEGTPCCTLSMLLKWGQ
ncbi:hypothetical protein [Marinicrinis lubricantis]|uniref:Uncharacterized protein n=1 Tax=Marinicrinis lubricantis TaxID=2086470 RepID=A0ABW1IJZ5_9BACL